MANMEVGCCLWGGGVSLVFFESVGWGLFCYLRFCLLFCSWLMVGWVFGVKFWGLLLRLLWMVCVWRVKILEC
jgi:hypothetical protein